MDREKKNDCLDDDILFAGEFVHAIDSQRRIAIPTNWRRKGADNVFYVLPGRNRTLQVMTYNSFKNLAQKLSRASVADSSASIALARLGSKSRECRCDRQGRIPIPEKLLEYAEIKSGEKINQELVLVGAINTIQIWSVENWRRQEMSDESMLDVLQEIEEKAEE